MTVSSPERAAIDRGWAYVVEPEGAPAKVVAADGRRLSRRLIGAEGRVVVDDETGTLPAAALLRVAHAVGPLTGDSARHVVLVEEEPLTAAAAAPTRHPAEAAAIAPPAWSGGGPAPRPARRALFFESLMASDLPHNDTELSQGVLHMVSGLAGTPTEPVFAQVKMPIEGAARPAAGLDSVEAALAAGPVDLVCITLLEGYWDGVVRLIATLRSLGCRAHVAVGGVMPTLTPEHVAAHLPDVTFVCRGAGEVFVPRLCAILGGSDVDTPLTSAQVDALLQLDGLLALDRARPGGLRLVSSRADRIAQVDALDRVPLDLRHIRPGHLVNGVELVTSRGCIHKCTFCSIIGREAYQARSAGGVIELLRRYAEHYRTLYDGAPPGNAFRLHLADDDFACDKPRAMAFFEQILATPFRLSSVQVSVADLCRRDERGVLLPEPDPGMLAALRPDVFADHGKGIRPEDHILDQRRRRWSAYLQIGVESYCDRELVRLGKGYRVAHIRAVVAAYAARRVHVDGYFIQSNADTTADDLVDVIDEIARLKLRFPVHFHVRFPAVPHLVSYFPSASHRRIVRQGRAAEVLVLRGAASVPGYPELDYPFVDHDRPGDVLVEEAVSAGFFTDEARYTASHSRLRERWAAHARDQPPGPARWRAEALLRRLDDRARRLAFEWLTQARGRDKGRVADDWPRQMPGARDALESAVAVLGPLDGWKAAYKAWSLAAPVVVVPQDADDDLRARAAGLAASTDRGSAVVTVAPPGRAALYVAADGALSWPNGRSAGHLDEARSLDRLSLPRSDGPAPSAGG